jgi:hypothetical protein
LHLASEKVLELSASEHVLRYGWWINLPSHDL